MRLLAFLLFLPCSLAQTLLPASTFGLSFREEASAWIYEGEGVRFVSSTHLTVPARGLCEVSVVLASL